MSLARKFLLLVGAISFLAGAAYLAFPAWLGSMTGFEMATPISVIEVRGFYGGQMAGIGLLTVFCALRKSLTSAGLLVTIATLGGTAAGRLFGMVTSGSVPILMAGLLLAEVATTLLAAFLLARREKPGVEAAPSSLTPAL